MQHDDPHRCTAFEFGQECFLKGRKYDMYMFEDLHRQNKYHAGYLTESNDRESVVAAMQGNMQWNSPKLS